MNNKKLYTFILLTFSWSWTIWIIGLSTLSEGVNQESIGRFIIYFLFGVYGPSISAIITTLIYDGFSGVVNLLKKLVIWKVTYKNYLYIVLLPLVFVIIGIGLYSVLIGDIGTFDKMAFLSIPSLLWNGLYAGPLGEELGWRGFLLTELQTRFSNLKSAIFIGVIWFIWHIPLWWAPFGSLVSSESISFLPVLIYLIMLICLSIIITWLVVRSKNSVLIAVLFHLSINAGIGLIFFPELNIDFKNIHFLSSIPMIIFCIFLIANNKLNRNE